MDLYSIGEMLVDFLPGREPGSYVRNPGGAPANVAIAVSRNGWRAGLCCSVGDDDFGRFLMGVLRENGVRPLGPPPCGRAVTTLAFVTLSEDGERSFTFVRRPGADQFLREEDVREADIRACRMVHAGSCSLSASPAAEATARALGLGRMAQKLVSFDLNYRGAMWGEDRGACAARVRRVLPQVDLLKVSEEEIDLVGGSGGIASLMADCGPTLVVETLGSAGARAFLRGEVLEVPGRRAVCVDATGAGDAFWGGFLSSLLCQGWRRRPT